MKRLVSQLPSGWRAIAGATLLAALLAPANAGAQPFGAWMTLVGYPTHGYVEIPSSPDLNATSAFTFEAWVFLTDPGFCDSIAGKNYVIGWWVGHCTELRSYLGGSSLDGGEIPASVWTHIAVTFDGSTHRHYINGELVAERDLDGPLSGNSDPVRIGSDVAWEFTAAGAIDEVRIWSLARTEEQIRDSINVPITTAQPGLEAVYALDGASVDLVGGHDGTVQGAGVGALTFPVGLGCTGTATTLCVRDRFAIHADWRTSPSGSPDGSALVVPFQTAESGLFTFFSPTNWEIQVKVLNGCGLNNRYWVFSAATTNVFYRMEVFDIEGGANKVYFNYPGPPAPAETDVEAFATCP